MTWVKGVGVDQLFFRCLLVLFFRKVLDLEMIEIRPKVVLIEMKLCQIMCMVDYLENEP